jgi:hypothetical protein
LKMEFHGAVYNCMATFIGIKLSGMGIFIGTSRNQTWLDRKSARGLYFF